MGARHRAEIDDVLPRGERSRARLASACLAAAASLLLFGAGAPAARADTSFGGDPTQAISPYLNCEYGAPPVFFGGESCFWNWAGPTAGDGIPFPETTGGSGTVTSVTLPAMPDPGPMQVVVVTGTLVGSSDPSIPSYDCCQITEISPTFTVPPNQITTVPLDLAVSSQATPNFAIPGASASYDGVGISVLSPTASLPLVYTGRTLIGSGADRNKAYFPAPSHPNGEYVEPTDPTGYELLARFTLGPAGGTAPASPAPGNPAPQVPPAAAPALPDGGLKLHGGPLTAAGVTAPLTLGQAQDPPTAATTQTLTVPAALAAAAGAKGKHAPVVIAKGSTRVPAGQTVSLRLSLTSAGRKLLARRRSLKVTETIVARNSANQTQTTTHTVTLRLQPAGRR